MADRTDATEPTATAHPVPDPAHTPCHCPHHTRTTGARRWGRLLGLVAVAVAASIGGSLTTVWAAHDFPDVGDTNPHHDDISWLVDNGITSGFGDGTFRPTNPVARQQMASFLRRYNAEIETVTVEGIAPDVTIWGDSATCPDGKRAVSGGGSMSGQPNTMYYSTAATGAWDVLWRTIGGGTLNGNEFQVWALCVPGL